MDRPTLPAGSITLFLSGDLMPGRGIDQVLPYPSNPVLYEQYVTNAKDYVTLAERKNAPIASPVSYAYIWGDALKEFKRVKPDLKLINLETSITTSQDYWKDKGINYRMHPENIACLTEAEIDCCSLANNHVIDWGYSGLLETLKTLDKAGLKTAGAGKTLQEAARPAVMDVKGKGRVLVFSYGVSTSGIAPSWAADNQQPGVNFLADLSATAVSAIKEQIAQSKQAGDMVVVSIHWGGNWGYEIPPEQKRFAHQLIDTAGVDVIHGHSSHHVKGIEVYKDRLILYGCGDLLDDYEGISGFEAFRGDLGLMYFASFDPLSGKLLQLQMTPTQIKHFKINKASQIDTLWLTKILNREGQKLGTRVELNPDGTFTLHWNHSVTPVSADK